MDENSDNSLAIAPAESGLRQADRWAFGPGVGQLKNHGVRGSPRLATSNATSTAAGGASASPVPRHSIPSSHDATGTTGAVAARPAPAPGNAVPSLSSQQSRDLDSAAVARQNEDVEMDEASGDAVRALGSTESESEGDAENGADGEEMWDLKRVLEAGQLTGPNAMECLTVDLGRCDPAPAPVDGSAALAQQGQGEGVHRVGGRARSTIWSLEEDETIGSMAQQGNNCSIIAAALGTGRTSNEIKTRWKWLCRRGLVEGDAPRLGPPVREDRAAAGAPGEPPGDPAPAAAPVAAPLGELRQAMLDKCTREAGPSVPGGVPPSMAVVNAAAGVDAAAVVQDGLRRSERKRTKSTQALESEAAEAAVARVAGVEAAAALDVDVHAASDGDGDGDGEGDGEGDWDLKEILDCREMGKPKPQMCMTDMCDLQACSKWVAQHDTENPWFSCVDCQVKDYEGWPTDPNELPLKYLTRKRGKMIAERCSKQDKPVMPNLPQHLPLQHVTFDGKLISEMPKDETFWTDKIILKMTVRQLMAVKRHVNLAGVLNERKEEHLIRHIREWRRGEREATGFPAEHRSKRMKLAHDKGENRGFAIAHKTQTKGGVISQEQFFATALELGLGMEPKVMGIDVTPDVIQFPAIELIAHELEIPAVGRRSAAERLMNMIESWNFVRDPRCNRKSYRKAQVWYHPDFDPKDPARPLCKLSEKEKEDVLALFYTK